MTYDLRLTTYDLRLNTNFFEKKMRYFIQLSYKGTNYHGWQIQPNAISVQEVLMKAFSKILRKQIEIVGAGRTDTGVHASFFIAHFELEQEIQDVDNLIFSLNNVLPFDIAIQKIWRVADDLHARFSALSREYKYFVSTKKNPFSRESAYYFHRELNVGKMNQAANLLFNYTDFTSFSKLHTDVFTNNCKIFHAKWTQIDSELIFTIKADRFLRNMVRAIVGTLLNVGLEKISVSDFSDIIESKNRSKAGFSVPAQGLFLTNIEY